MNAFDQLFTDLDGGCLLDVATGEGGYITFMQRYLDSYTQITGIDSNHKVLSTAAQKFPSQKVHFTTMQAESLGFDSESFDTVNISASLHHLENVNRVLAEMERVLKPGGNFILTEMHRDGSTEAQFNAIRIHHWAAAVDSKLGILHDRTFSRQEILAFIDELSLNIQIVRDFSSTGADPLDEKAIAGVGGYLDGYHQRLENQPGNHFLLEQENELRRALEVQGFQREPVVIVIAKKSGTSPSLKNPGG